MKGTKKSFLPVIMIIGLAALITILILLFVTPGFYHNKYNKEKTEEAAKEHTAAQETAKEVTGDPQENEAVDNEEKNEATVSADKAEEEPEGSKYLYFTLTKEEEVIADKNKVKVTVKELFADSETGDLYLRLSINNGTDKKINVSGGEGYVNGLLAVIELDEKIDPGETKDTDAIFRSYSIKNYNIERIGELELDFSAADADSGEELFVSEPASVKTDLYGTFEQKYPDFGDTGALKISSDDEATVKGLTAYFIDFYPEGELTPEDAAVVFYAVNNTENDYRFSSGDISINGEPATGYIEDTLWAGRQGMLMFRITGLKEDVNIEEIELGIDIYKGRDPDSDKPTGHFSVLYNPKMEKPEETAARFSTDEVPTDDDFLFFCKVFDGLSEKKKVNYDHEAYSGGYKGFLMIYDDSGKNVTAIRYLKAQIKSLDDSITVTLHPVSEYDVKADKTKDISKEEDMEFTGKWNADDDFTATGSGTIDMAIVSTDDGQYALGDFIYPSGEKAELGFMRP